MRVHDDWLLTAERAAVHLPTGTAVIADLHLGYAEARRRRGEAVPVPDLDAILTPLRTARARHGFDRVVIAGDLFEDGYSVDLAAQLNAWLEKTRLQLLGVTPGNHDRGMSELCDMLPVCAGGMGFGDWRVVHGDDERPSGRTICGHFHPWLRWGRISAPCFLVDEMTIVVPAFSRDARGVNVRQQPRWRGHRCCAIAGGDVLDMGRMK